MNTTAEITADMITAETHTQYRLAFEMQPCGRCGATGAFGPMSVESGRCFDCRGLKKVRTRDGQRAFKLAEKYKQDNWSAQASEIVEGDTVLLSNRWRRVFRVDTQACDRSVTVGTEVKHYTQQLCIRYGGQAQAGLIVLPDQTMLRMTDENRAAYLRRMLTVKGAIVALEDQDA